MLKVFLVVRWPVGGIRTFIKYVYTRWQDPQLELHILTPKLKEVEILSSDLKGLNCCWYCTESSSPSFKDFSLMAGEIIKDNNFDLIHTHGFTSALAIAWRLPFLRSKSIFTSHDVLNQNQFTGIAGFVKRFFISFCLNRYSVIHSVSHDAERNLLQNMPLLKKEKCAVILNGIDTERFFDAKPINLKKQLGLSESVKLIGFFGRFMSQKGFRYLVDAMEILEESHPNQFKVVCFGSGGFIREEKVALQKRGLSELFYFHEHVSDTAPYVKSCDLVAMPSLWEACGLVAMEVLAAGVPLVASRCIGLAEVCERTPALMVEPGDSVSLAQGVLGGAVMPRSLFTNFAIEARSRYAVSTRVRELEALYRKVMGV